MKTTKKNPKFLLPTVVVGGLGLLAFLIFGPGAGDGAISVKVPSLSPLAVAGETAFNANCAACHGKNGGGGTKLAPPLVHDTYNLGHHPDDSFRAAVHNGTTQHHWHFGDMPPTPQVTDAQLTRIIRYIRELQEANGIVARPHQM
ncbi:MAG: hypothetical protein A3E79_00060 [Burkholderiales bacterium RIFCSPHIGHO2_12_FULL_61_11]|nr:MAG: hypothetical protein A3E79_00060 [Burkholderiales bacterium RIFCSPHIGHO2_12_FULL_61_11]